MNEPPKDKRTKEYKQWLKENSTGLGDTVDYVLNETPLKTITKAVKKVVFKQGKDCGCDQRRKKLNQIMAYRLKPVRCFTEKEHDEYNVFKETRALTLTNGQIKFVCKLYADIFNKPYYEPCRNCSPKPMLKMIESLDKVFDSYEGNI